MSVTDNYFLSLAYLQNDERTALNSSFVCGTWLKKLGKNYLFAVNHLSFCPPNEAFKNIFFFRQLLFKLPSNTYLPPIESSCGWAPAVFLCERRSDPPGLLLGRLDIGTSLLKGHTLSRHYHSLKGKKRRKKYQLYVVQHRNQIKGSKDEGEILGQQFIRPNRC